MLIPCVLTWAWVFHSMLGRHEAARSLILCCIVGGATIYSDGQRVSDGFRVPLGVRAPPTYADNLSLVCNFSVPTALLRTVGRHVTAVAATASRVVPLALAFEDYLRGKALPTDALVVFRDLKGAGVAPKRILLYLTTHCTKCHLVHLQSCWPESILKARNLLADADVLLYAGCSHYVKYPARWADALVRLPNANVSLSWTRWNPGYQQGSIAAMIVAIRRRWFDAYEWVIRANPDVLVVNHNALAAALKPFAAAYLYTCCNNETLINTDFFATRPSAMNGSWWGRGLHHGNINAEASAVQVFRSSIENGTAVLTAGLGDGCRGKCRTASAGVTHSHAHCEQQPWGLELSRAAP